MLGAIRNGASDALFISGDPGIGKSTLLGSMGDDIAGITVLRIAGYEIESAVPYGALQRLGGPLAGRIDEIEATHKDAIRVATGVQEGPPPSRMLVGLAGLSLLAKSAEAQPLLCIVDDAQYLDAESLEVLGFIARRLSAESVGMLFASRDDDQIRTGLGGVQELVLTGLAPEESAELLRHSLPRHLDPSVEAGIVEATGGNPLALQDLAREWDVPSLTRATIAGSPAPVGPRLEAHYALQVRALPHATQLWLLVAAAESAGNHGFVSAAAARLGLAPDASGAAERAGLVEIRDNVRFRHALVRSAIYGAAEDADRRAVHRALSAEAEAADLEEFAAWHAAAAADGPDTDLAERFVALADRAGARGGYVSRARLLARAADMTAQPAERDVLVVRAAEAAMMAGQALLALELTDHIDPQGLDLVTRGRLLITLASCDQFLMGRPGLFTAKDRYLAAADDLHDAAPTLEQYALLLAIQVMQSTASADDHAALPALGERLLRGADAAPGPLSVALRAFGSLIRDPYEQAVPYLRTASAMVDELDDATLIMLAPFAWLPGVALWEGTLALANIERIAGATRRAGALRELYGVTWSASAVALSCGNPKLAADYLRQASDARHAVGYRDETLVNPAHLAWIGTPLDDVRKAAEAIVAAGYGGVAAMANAAIGVRQLAEGAYADALATLRANLRRPFVQASYYQYPDLVEAGVRSGVPESIAGALETMRNFARASGSDWAKGTAARCEALVADDAHAETWYRASVAELQAPAMAGALARTQLLYGEWLRRQGRRSDAGVQIAAAYAAFQEVGAVAFVERAKRELLATGVSVPPSLRDALGELTPQEVAVARLAAAGKTNGEIGSVLFISPNTVDYHLRKVFRKLGLTSRRQLSAALKRPS